MKSLVLILAIVSFSSFACPDLTGTYTQCDSASRRDLPEDLIVKIKMTNSNSYLITYESEQEISTQEVIADGIEREGTIISSRFGTIDFTVKASCFRSELTVSGTTRLIGLPVRETSKLRLAGGVLHIDRIKFGRVIESFRCQ